jgi:hypothetical protein
MLNIPNSVNGSPVILRSMSFLQQKFYFKSHYNGDHTRRYLGWDTLGQGFPTFCLQYTINRKNLPTIQ